MTLNALRALPLEVEIRPAELSWYGSGTGEIRSRVRVPLRAVAAGQREGEGMKDLVRELATEVHVRLALVLAAKLVACLTLMS
jgi:hypothetical protein